MDASGSGASDKILTIRLHMHDTRIRWLAYLMFCRHVGSEFISGVIVLVNHTLKQALRTANECAQKIQKNAVGKVVGAGLLAITVLFTTTTISPAATSQRRIEVAAKRYVFEPAEITIKAGESIDLVLTSADVPHGVRFHELGVDLNTEKGKPAEAKFTPHETGTFIGHCSVFCGSGHGKMTLTIHVVG